MIGDKRKLENEITKLEKLKQEIIDEKNCLEKIKEILDEKSSKFDITNMYIYTYNNISYIVKLNIENEVSEIYNGVYKKQYKSTLKNIFNDNVVYEKNSFDKIKRKEPIKGKDIDSIDTYAKIIPILEIEPDLMIYPDNLVPSYVLQQLLYKLNNVNLSNPILKK